LDGSSSLPDSTFALQSNSVGELFFYLVQYSEYINFSGRDTDDVLIALKRSERFVFSEEIQEKCLSGCQVLKIEEIFIYLYKKFKHRFDFASYNPNYGVQLSYNRF